MFKYSGTIGISCQTIIWNCYKNSADVETIVRVGEWHSFDRLLAIYGLTSITRVNSRHHVIDAKHDCDCSLTQNAVYFDSLDIDSLNTTWRCRERHEWCFSRSCVTQLRDVVLEQCHCTHMQHCCINTFWSDFLASCTSVNSLNVQMAGVWITMPPKCSASLAWLLSDAADDGATMWANRAVPSHQLW